FFFQAEDGIRDFHVTGVQTCALPILAAQREPIEALRRRVTRGERAARLTGARDELDNRLADRAELQRDVEGAHEELERWQAQLEVLRKESEALEAQRPDWRAAEQRAQQLEGFEERVAGLAEKLDRRAELERDVASSKDRLAAVEHDHAETIGSA